MKRLSTYLYGIVRAGTEMPPGLAGLEDDSAVCAFPCGQLTAVRSVVSRDDFEADGPADPAWVIPRALRHEFVIEKMALLGPILPVRFGALFSTEAALADWISFNNDVIVRFLDDVVDKEEWAFSVQIEPERAYETLVAEDPDWAEQARALPISPGTRYFHEKRLREKARQHVRQKARGATDSIRTAARALAEERVLVPRKPEQLDVEQVASLTYLVSRDLVKVLLERVRLAASDAACLRVVPSGPWPPAHFCPLLAEPPEGEDVASTAVS